MAILKKTSLKDIAQQVGVSTALVSYVLNNKKEGRIGKEIAQKIRETAVTLNYRTNQAARSLKTQKTFTLGLLVPDISNPFFGALARAVADEANRHQYTVFSCSSDEDPVKSKSLLEMLVGRQVDGLIIAPGEHAETQLAELRQQEIPFVLIDRYYPDTPANYVALDNFRAAYIAVQHLLDNGYKRIGLMAYDTTHFHINERKRGYLAALKDNKIAFNKGWLREKGWVKELNMENRKPEIERAVDELRLAQEPVDAILFMSKNLTEIGVKHIHTRGIKVPDKLALVGFDETESLDLFAAPLTYIKQPLADMGQHAVAVLMESIQRNNKITQVNMEPELVIGQSSARS